MAGNITEITEGILKLQFEIPYNVQPVNMYLLAMDPVTLIDTGPIMREVKDEIPRTLAELGFPPSEVRRIVITHHPDHMGMAARVKRAGGAEVVCHRAGERLVSDYWGESDRMGRFLVDIATYVGLDRDLAEATMSETGQWKEVAEPVQVDRLVDDGDVIPGDPHDLLVVHAPGHSIDHICLYLEGRRLLFTGDMLLHSITPNPDVYPPWVSDRPSGLPDYIDSLFKIRELDVATALPGHGRCIDDMRGRVDQVLRHHRERLEYILETLRDSELTLLQLALDLLGFIGADVEMQNVFLAMREVYGHLVILGDQGRVWQEIKDGVGYFSAA